MGWQTELAYLITPKSGPLRPMRTLLDANRALTQDLPIGWLRRPHWAVAGRLLLSAVEDPHHKTLAALTEALVTAVEREGWMEHVTLASRAERQADGRGPN